MSEEFPKNPGSPEQPDNEREKPSDQEDVLPRQEDLKEPADRNESPESPEKPERKKDEHVRSLPDGTKRLIAGFLLEKSGEAPSAQEIDVFKRKLEEEAHAHKRKFSEHALVLMESMDLGGTEEARALREKTNSGIVQWETLIPRRMRKQHKRALKAKKAGAPPSEEPEGDSEEEPVNPEEAAESAEPGEESAETSEGGERWREEYESSTFDNVKAHYDPVAALFRECGVSHDSSDIQYVVTPENGAPEDRTRYGNWHDAKRAIGSGKAHFLLSQEFREHIQKVLEDKESELYRRRGDFEAILRSIASNECPDEYPEIAAEMHEVREKARRDAVAAELSDEPRDEERMKALNPVRRKLSSYGLAAEKIDALHPSYYVALRAPGSEEAGVVREVGNYHYAVVNRAELPEEQRLEADQAKFDDPRDPDNPELGPWQKVTVSFPAADWEALKQDLTEEQYFDLLDYIELKVRHEAVPDEYAEEVLAKKAIESGAPDSLGEFPSEKAEEGAGAEKRAETADELRARYESAVSEIKEAKRIKDELLGKSARTPDEEQELERVKKVYAEKYAEPYDIEERIVALQGDEALAGARTEYEAAEERRRKARGTPEEAEAEQERNRLFRNYLDEKNRVLDGVLGKRMQPEAPDVSGSSESESESAGAEEKFSQEYGISSEELGTIEGWNDLKGPQKKLVADKFAQIVLGRLNDEASDEYDKKTGKKALSSTRLGRIWYGRTKMLQTAKEKQALAPEVKQGGIAMHGKALAEIVRTVKDLDVMEGLDGKAFVTFLPLSRMEEVNGRKIELSPEEQDAVGRFNKLAYAYSNIPNAWGQAARGKDGVPRSLNILPRKHGEYRFSKRNYEKLRAQVLNARLKHNGGDKIEATSFMNAIDKDIWISRALATDPAAEQKLSRISEESPYWQAIRDSRGEGAAGFAAGYAARSLAHASLAAAAAPFAMIGISGMRGWLRGRRELLKREEDMRRGKDVRNLASRTERKIGKYEAKIARLLEDERKMKSRLEQMSPEAQKEARDNFRKKREALERKIKAKNNEAFEEKRADKDFVYAGAHTILRGGKERRVMGLAERMQHSINKVENETDPAKRAKLARRLELRLSHTQGKLDAGLVRFSGSGKAGEQGERMAEEINLIEALCAATTYLGAEKALNPEFKKPREKIEDWRRDKATRVFHFQEHRQKANIRAQRAFKMNTALRAALGTAAFSAAGAIAADYFRPSDEASMFEESANAVKDAKEQAVDSVPDTDAAVRDAAAKIEAAFGDGEGATAIVETADTPQHVEAAADISEVPHVSDTPDISGISDMPETGGEGDALAFVETAPASDEAVSAANEAVLPSHAVEAANESFEGPESVIAEAPAAEAVQPEVPAGAPRPRIEGLVDAGDRYQVMYARQAWRLDEAIRDMKGVRDLPEVRANLKAVTSHFEKQPLFIQEDAMRRVEGLRAEIERLNRIGSKLTPHEAREVIATKKVLDEMEADLLKTKEALAAKLREVGYGTDSSKQSLYDTRIKGNRDMTVGSVLRAYQDERRKPFVKWIVEDGEIGLKSHGSVDKGMHIDDYIRSHFRASRPRSGLFRG